MKTCKDRPLEKLIIPWRKSVAFLWKKYNEFLISFVLHLQSKMIYTVLCYEVSTERQASKTKMRDRVQSCHRHNSSILPLKRGEDEEKDGGIWENTVISGLDRGERKKEEEKKKLGFPQPICQLLLFIGLKVKIELTTDFLYLLSYFEGPVIHSYPCSFLGSSSAQSFMLLQQLAHKIHLFI